MHFSCQCGILIHDTADNLPYKGKIIADQDFNTLWDLIEKLEKQHIDRIDVYNKIHDLLMREIYQCPKCGRIYIENQAQNYDLVGFQMESPEQQEKKENRSLLLSAYGEKWKGHLYAEWRDEKPDWWCDHHGIIMPEVNIKMDNLVFDDYDAFEKRFYEVFEELKVRDIIVSASLKANGKTIFTWPGKK